MFVCGRVVTACTAANYTGVALWTLTGLATALIWIFAIRWRTLSRSLIVLLVHFAIWGITTAPNLGLQFFVTK